MADETVDIDVNVNTNIEGAESSFTRLQTQIRETTRLLQEAEAAGDQAAFNQYKKNLDELEDKLEITTLKQKQLDDTLAAAPGPLGKAGQAVKAFDGVLKFLAANPIVAIFAGLAAILTTVIAALNKTKEGTAALTAVTDAFGNILQPVIAFISKAAVPVFKAFADIVNFFATELGLVDAKVVAAKENFRLLEGQIKQNNATLEGEIEILTAQGAAIDKIAAKKKEQIDGEIQLLEQKKIAFGEITADEEAQIIALNQKKKVLDAEVEVYNNKKAEEAFKKRQERFNKDLDVFDSSQKTRASVQQKYFDEEKFRLDSALAQGTITQTEYDQQSFINQQDFNAEALAEQDRFLQARETKLREGLKKGLITQAEFDALSLEIREESTEAKNAIVKTGFEQEISYINNAAKALQDLESLQIEVNKNIAQSYIDLGQTIGQSFATLANLFETGSDAQKIFGVTSVIINAATAIGKIILDTKENISSAQKVIQSGVALQAQGAAVAATSFINPANAIIGPKMIAAGTLVAAKGSALALKAKVAAGTQIAAVGLASTAQIAAITNAKKSAASSAGAGVGEGASGGAGSGGLNLATPAIGAPQIGAGAVTQQGTIAGIVAGAIQGNQSQGKPIRAYVVGNDITSQQQLERRLRTAARLGG
jgi:hypothetical protein